MSGKSQRVKMSVVDPCMRRTMPNKLSTDAVSMVCSAGTSTFSNENSGRNGMVGVYARTREEQGTAAVLLAMWKGNAGQVRMSSGARHASALSRYLGTAVRGSSSRLFRSVTRIQPSARSLLVEVLTAGGPDTFNSVRTGRASVGEVERSGVDDDGML